MPGRRLLLTFVASCAVLLPACLHIGASATPITTPEQAAKAAGEATQPTPPKKEFAVLPKVPGEVVQTKPGAATTSNTNANTTAQKPNNTPPANPSTGVKHAGGEPGLFPPMLPSVTMPPEAPLLAAVRAYTEGRPEQAIEIIRKMDKANQDFILAVLPILASGAGANLTNDPATTAALVEQLRATAARLEPRAALKVEKVVFCSEVAGFGRFISRPEANPYKPNERAQLYFELRNLGNQLTGDGFLTHVQAAVEIRDANNKLIEQIDKDDWHRRVPVVKHEKRLVTRSPLQDFHVICSFAAPTTPGVYTVTVQFSDSTGRRTVKSQPAEFRVAGP